MTSLRTSATRGSRHDFGAVLTYLIVSAGFATSYVLTVWRRDLFAPDTRYYFAMALNYGGTSKEAAAAKVADLSARFGWDSPPADILFGWGLVQPRVVYPALSTPFVKLFGVNGLAVVSGLAMFAVVVVLTALLVRRYGAPAAVGTMLVIVSSTQIVFYGSAMLTESLSALWSALIVVVAFAYVRSPRRAHLVALLLLTVVAGFTRQATLIPAGALVVAWIAGLLVDRRQRWGPPAWVVAGTTVAVQLLQTWMFPTFSQQNQFLAATETDSLPEAMAATPALLWHILRVDAWQWAATDLAVPVLGVVALVSMVVLWRRPESHMLLGALLAVGLYNLTNGTPVGIRYAMPGLVFFALALGQVISAAGRALSGPDRVPDPHQKGADH